MSSWSRVTISSGLTSKLLPFICKYGMSVWFDK
jgi:hypothetical protein